MVSDHSDLQESGDTEACGEDPPSGVRRGIIKETTGRARDRVFVYARYMDAMAANDEALKPQDNASSRG